MLVETPGYIVCPNPDYTAQRLSGRGNYRTPSTVLLGKCSPRIYAYSEVVTMTKLDPEGNPLLDDSPCAGVRADLKLCLLESDCVKKYHKTPRECLRDGAVPNECLALRNVFFECKRSILDNRQRFRGRKGY